MWVDLRHLGWCFHSPQEGWTSNLCEGVCRQVKQNKSVSRATGWDLRVGGKGEWVGNRFIPSPGTQTLASVLTHNEVFYL